MGGVKLVPELLPDRLLGSIEVNYCLIFNLNVLV
jgi:hypothetical protein